MVIHFELSSGTINNDAQMVEFWANDNGFPVPCRITCAELAALAGCEECRDNVLELFDALQLEIFEIARERYYRYDTELDGSLLIGCC